MADAQTYGQCPERVAGGQGRGRGLRVMCCAPVVSVQTWGPGGGCQRVYRDRSLNVDGAVLCNKPVN